jgi:hypothetical protein
MKYRSVSLVVILKTGAGKLEELALRPPTLQPKGQRIEAASVADNGPRILKAKCTVQTIFECHLEPDHNALEKPFLGRNIDQPRRMHGLR